MKSQPAGKWWLPGGAGIGNNARVLFERRLQAGLSDGSIRLAFRRWRQPQVVPGRRYRSPVGMIEVDALSRVSEPISIDDAHAAGYASVDALLEDLKGPADADLFRVELRRSLESDPRTVLAAESVLSADELRQLEQKLARLDASAGRAWTRATLEAIEAQPGRRAGDLYTELGWSELQDFKLHVRRLKALGLTLSLRIGYELSPRGQAFVQAQRAGAR